MKEDAYLFQGVFFYYILVVEGRYIDVVLKVEREDKGL